MGRSILVLLVVGMLGALALYLYSHRGDVVPMQTLTPAMPIARHGGAESARSPATGAAGAPAGITDASANGDRTAVEPTPTLLSVRCVEEGTLAPIPGIDVAIAAAVRTQPPHPLHVVARTDATGTVQTRVALTSPLRLHIQCARGSHRLVDVLPGVDHVVTLAVPATIALDGTIVDTEGQPIADAELWFHLWQPEPVRSLPTMLGCGRSAADGTFHLDFAGAGDLAATHPRFAPSALVAVHDGTEPDQPATHTVRLVLGRDSGTVHGQVVDGDDRALAGAEVEFTSPGQHQPPLRVTADAQGRFATAALLPGNTNYVAIHAVAGCTRGSVEVPVGGMVECRIRIAGAARLTGIVRDSYGTPVRAASVAILGIGLAAAECRTAEDGSYQLADLPPGRCEAIVEAPDRRRNGAGPAGLEPMTMALHLAAGQTQVWNPVLPASQPGIELLGTVVDRRGSPVRGWQVVVTQGGVQWIVRSGDDGGFTAVCRPGSKLDIEVFEPEHDTRGAGFAAACLREVEPAVGAVRIEVDPTLQSATLRGRVRCDAAPGARPTLQCWHRQRRENLRLPTAGDGSFDLQHVPPGVVDLYFECQGSAPLARRSIELPPGALVDLGTIALEAGAGLFGQIRRSDGATPTDIQITVETKDQRLPARIDGGGYRIDSLPAGEVRLLVSGDGIAAVAHAVTLQAGVEQQLDIDVVPGVSRRLAVFLPPGNGAFVSVSLRETGKEYTWIAGQPRPHQGTVEFRACMHPGSYEVIAFDDEGMMARATIAFERDDEVPFELTLKPR